MYIRVGRVTLQRINHRLEISGRDALCHRSRPLLSMIATTEGEPLSLIAGEAGNDYGTARGSQFIRRSG